MVRFPPFLPLQLPLMLFYTDEQSLKPRKFLIDVEETMKLVLEQEDSDANFQVRSFAFFHRFKLLTSPSCRSTPPTRVPRSSLWVLLVVMVTTRSTYAFPLLSLSSLCETRSLFFVQIRGTYMLSNLLQELALARDHGQKQIVLDEARLNENPVSRLSRMIRHSFWSNLTRRIDGDGLEKICADPKVRFETGFSLPPFPPPC
jgi:alpha,alpha-trehalase